MSLIYLFSDRLLVLTDMNQSAPETDEITAPQHYECQARTSVIVPALALAIISPILMHISLNKDPQHGNVPSPANIIHVIQILQFPLMTHYGLSVFTCD